MKDVNVSLTDNLSELSDEELLGKLKRLHASLAHILADEDGSAVRPQVSARVH